MATDGPVSASSWAPAHVAMSIWARGCLRDNTPPEVAGIVANFRRDVVPLTDGHWGRTVGWLRAVQADGLVIWFTALVGDASMADRVRRGPVSISLEIEGRGVLPRPDERGFRFGWTSRDFRGSVGPGWTLTAVAVLRDSDRPGAVGSRLSVVE
jgi:hypothetical protein